MSVSTDEIKEIIVQSYSEMFGGVDTRYIILTRFLETSPGTFDYTCDVLIPQSTRFEATLSTVQGVVDAIGAFNKDKGTDEPRFVDIALKQHLVTASQKVLGDRPNPLFAVSGDNEAVVTSKSFGNPRQQSTRKRRTVVNPDKNVPLVHSLEVDGTHDHLYRDTVSPGIDVYRRKDGSSYQVETIEPGDQIVTEVDPADPTFVTYTFKGFTRHDEAGGTAAVMTRTDTFSSFANPTVFEATFSADDDVLLSGNVEQGVVGTTTARVVLTAFPLEEQAVFALPPVRSFGNVSGLLSIDQENVGGNVFAGDALVPTSALNVVYVHLIAENPPFYVRDTFRLERAGYNDAPYVRIDSVDPNTTGLYVDVVGTVFSSARIAKAHVLVFVGTDGLQVDQDFVQFYGDPVEIVAGDGVTTFNKRAYKAYTSVAAPETTSVITVGQVYNVVVLAEDSHQRVTVETSSVYVEPELRMTLSVADTNSIHPPTVVTSTGFSMLLEPTDLSGIEGRITSVRLSYSVWLNTTEGYTYEFTLSAALGSRNRADYFLMVGNSLSSHVNARYFSSTNGLLINIAKLSTGSSYVWTRNVDAWFSAQNVSLNPDNTEFSLGDGGFPDYWRMTMVTRTSSGQRDALIQVFRDPARLELVMYGYLSDVARFQTHEFHSDVLQIGFGCSVYDQGTTGYAPDSVTFSDFSARYEKRKPGLYRTPQGENVFSVRETSWIAEEGPDYDLSDNSTALRYGRSSALSADATVVVIGGYASDLVGGVYVMEYDPVFDGWGKATADGRFAIGERHDLVRTTTWDLPDSSAGQLGESTDVSGDGKTLIVSGSIRNSYTDGRAWIYEYDDATKAWGRFQQQEGGGGERTFIPGGYHDLSRTGTLGKYGRVSRLSLNGKVAVVSGDTYKCAFVWTFDESTATWIMKQDLTLDHSNYGASVALSADGRVIVVGRSPATTYGQLYVWTYNVVTDAYTNTHLIHNPNTVGRFGSSTDVSADGRVIVSGGYKTNTSGCAFVYHYNESTDQWGRFVGTADGSSFVHNEPHNLSVTTGANGRYGRSCSMSADGRTVVVSGDFGGDCYVWTYTDYTWTMVKQIANNNDTHTTDYGMSSDISADGTTLLVSGSLSNTSNNVLVWKAVDTGGRDLVRLTDEQVVGAMPSLSLQMREAIADLPDNVYDSSVTLTYKDTVVSSGNDHTNVHQFFAGGLDINTDSNSKKYFMIEYSKSFGEFNVGPSNFTIALVLSAKGYDYNSTSRITYGITPGYADSLNINASSTQFGFYPLKYPIPIVDPDRFMTSDYFMLLVSYNKDLDGGTLIVIVQSQSSTDAQTHRFVNINGDINLYDPSNTIDRIFTLWNQNREPFRIFDMMIFPGESIEHNSSLMNQITYYVKQEYNIVPQADPDNVAMSHTFVTLFGTGWTLIKSLPGTSKTWYPGNDNLIGYPGSEFLFTRGDFSAWLIAPHSQVSTTPYGYTNRAVTKSSRNPNPHVLKWYFRTETIPADDPWISLEGHNNSADHGTMMYGEGSSPAFNDSVHHSGMYVYTR
jgi:hypothetical protein